MTRKELSGLPESVSGAKDVPPGKSRRGARAVDEAKPQLTDGREKGEAHGGGSSRIPHFVFDADYVARLVGEDPETERHFIRYFGSLLSLKLRPKLRSPAQVEDAKQETFLRVLTTLKKKGGLATPESLGAFVSSVANNVVFELYRAGKKSTSLAEDHDGPDERVESTETSLTAAEERVRIRETLNNLPPKEKQLVRWLFFEGRDEDEVCRELNVDRKYLRVLVRRAKKRLRLRLGADGSRRLADANVPEPDEYSDSRLDGWPDEAYAERESRAEQDQPRVAPDGPKASERVIDLRSAAAADEQSADLSLIWESSSLAWKDVAVELEQVAASISRLNNRLEGKTDGVR